MKREHLKARFHDAGVRVEIADICARIAAHEWAKERSRLISEARRRGLSLAQVAAAFGLTPEGVRVVVSSGAGGELKGGGETIGALVPCPSFGAAEQ